MPTFFVDSASIDNLSVTGSVTVSGSLQVSGIISGSFTGTSSYASQALSASFASTASIATSSSFASTASLAPSYTLLTTFNSFTSSIRSGSFTGSFTGSVLGTSSFATNALSSSFATTASFTAQALSSSFAATASFAPAYTTLTAFNTFTGSFRTGSFTGSFTGSVLGTASFATQALSSSFSTTSSLPLQGVVTASVVDSTITFRRGDGTTFPISLSQSGSIATASYATFAETARSSSFATTASFALNGGGGAAFPFSGNATITGSLTVSGSNHVLKVIGSGSNIFSVSGSKGSIFQISENETSELLTVSSASVDVLSVTTTGASITGRLNVSNGITGSLSGTASYATAGGGRFIYNWNGTSINANGTVWTNMPLLTASFGNAAANLNLSSSVYIADFTNSTHCRLFTSLTVAAVAAAHIQVQYSADGITFDALTPPLVLGTVLGKKDTGWTEIPVPARGFEYIRLIGYGGNGNADPAMSLPTLLVK
jgi:hypothetical protein